MLLGVWILAMLPLFLAGLSVQPVFAVAVIVNSFCFAMMYISDTGGPYVISKTTAFAASLLESAPVGEIMPSQIFISLPVHNLQNSIRFYESLGYRKNPQFSDDAVASFDMNELIHLMLATHDKFSELTPKQIADPSMVCHSLLSLLCESREEVNSIVSRAIAAGGSQAHEPEDHGFMYQYGFYDLDGHGWGVFWFDQSVQPGE